VLLLKPICLIKFLKFKTEKSMFKSRLFLKLITKIRDLHELVGESFRRWQLLRWSSGEAHSGQTHGMGFYPTGNHEVGEKRR
jgi:hypothetical protein